MFTLFVLSQSTDWMLGLQVMSVAPLILSEMGAHT